MRLHSINLPKYYIIQRSSFYVFWYLLCRFTPPFMHSWRCFVLKLWGAKIGSRVHVYPSVKIWLPKNLVLEDDSCLASSVEVYNVCFVSIGKNSIVSQGSYLCTASHDYQKASFDLIGANIRIGDNVWVSSKCFIGPGVNVGDFSVGLAHSVIIKDVCANTVVAGNPASFRKERKLR